MTFKDLVFRVSLFAALVVAGLGTAVADDQLVVHRIKAGSGPVLDPDDAVWKKAAALTIGLQAQMVATPQSSEPAVAELSVRAVHDGKWITFKLFWADPTKSDLSEPDHFGD
ncbi:MAG: hypothetical protein HQL37_11405, partial [Alphaproteobacteria bacterium]|nr:hypothetical protein [Alphaproteobacteria bacterium]